MPTDDSTGPHGQVSARKARLRGAGELAELVLRLAVRIMELVDLFGSGADVM
ncbi:hypothetical protein TPA0907_08010 [Micromonospora humidisoli]|nr:hypothetical protein TPA0907_08010 [Micromonospora sp. AKA109]